MKVFYDCPEGFNIQTDNKSYLKLIYNYKLIIIKMKNSVIFILLVLFFILLIMCTCFYENNYRLEVEIIDYNNESIKNLDQFKCKEVEVNLMSSVNLYFEIPSNSIFWDISIKKNDTEIHNINMLEYENNNIGDMVHLCIVNNPNVLTRSINYYKYYNSIVNRYSKYNNTYLNVTGFITIEFNIYNNKENCYYSKNIEISRLEFTGIKSELLPDIYRYNNKISTKSINLINSNQYTVYAVNHYKNKTAIHSNVQLINCETNKIFHTEFTGIICDSILNNNQLEIRKILIDPPNNIEKFYIIENIFLNNIEYQDLDNLKTMKLFINN